MSDLIEELREANTNTKLCSEAADRIEQLEAAIKNLKDQKGRHNTEIAYNRLMELIK